MRIGGRLTATGIALFFAAAMYTTNGCGGFPTEPGQVFASEVRGTVTDASSGAPVSGALVSIIRGNTQLVGSADANGRYAIQTDAGQATVEATATGYVRFTMQINVRDGVNTVDIRMTRVQ
jgi:hypothetical protein